MDLSGLQLETPRLLLRLPQHEDLDAVAAFLADEVATRYIGGSMPRALAWRSLATMRGSWELQGFAMFSVIEKDSGRGVGRVGPWKPEGWPGTEVGWSIVRERWGRGYASEAAAACIDWAFATLGWEQVIHTIDPDNAGGAVPPVGTAPPLPLSRRSCHRPSAESSDQEQPLVEPHPSQT